MINLDFEEASTDAFSALFPDAVISYCLFHLSWNAYKNVLKKGLSNAYTTIEEARTLLRCLPALSFLPVDEVFDGFNNIYEALLEAPDTPIPAGLEDSTAG